MENTINPAIKSYLTEHREQFLGMCDNFTPAQVKEFANCLFAKCASFSKIKVNKALKDRYVMGRYIYEAANEAIRENSYHVAARRENRAMYAHEAYGQKYC